MNVIIAATKACCHCPMIKKELRKLGIDSSVHYFEEHSGAGGKIQYQTFASYHRG